MTEAATAIGASWQSVRGVCASKNWTHRFRSTKRSSSPLISSAGFGLCGLEGLGAGA
ncbi:hypothetical protein [Oceaniglobus trochenteri]|uniref:hypothetical protein n=1 Tax=Oceaniglobus trochenteri TaxID=2763260 RepID=UPI001CFFE4AD|nr:hypothetical protein [Oceaniglobus trochenteri]